MEIQKDTRRLILNDLIMLDDLAGYRQVLCANSFTSLAEQSLHKAGNLPLITSSRGQRARQGRRSRLQSP